MLVDRVSPMNQETVMSRTHDSVKLLVIRVNNPSTPLFTWLPV